MNQQPSPDALPWVLLNGRMVPARQAMVSIFDRSFQLGDGLFETLRILNGWPIQWRQHWARLAAAARTLKIPLSPKQPAALAQALDLIHRNASPEAVLRVHLSRGCGPRGYSPRGARQPQLVMAMFRARPLNVDQLATVRLGIASSAIHSRHCLHQLKTASRMLNVLAKAGAEANGLDDALLLDDRERVLETTSSNFFWFRGRTLVTPPPAAGILAGTTRSTVLKLAARLGIPVLERLASLQHVLHGNGAFLTVSTGGVIEVQAISGQAVPSNPSTARLHAELLAAWQREAARSLAPRKIRTTSANIATT